MSVEFKDFSMQVKAALEEKAIQFLHEASSEILAETARNTPVDTGQLKGSWEYDIDKSKLESKLGSGYENAIWTEFGTGEYALKGNGRKGGWKYKDQKGNWHFTKGKKPVRMFFNAYTAKKPKIIKRAEQIFKGLK